MKILNFSAVWCHGCLLMKSIVAEIQKEYPDLEIIEYDLDDDLEAVNKWKIGDKIPVYIFLNNDLEKERIVGEVSKKKFKEVIDRCLEGK